MFPVKSILTFALMIGVSAMSLASDPKDTLAFSPDFFDSKQQVVPNVVLLAFKPEATYAQRADLLDRYGLDLDTTSNSKYFTRLLVPDGMLGRSLTLDDILISLSKDPIIKYAEADRYLYPDQAATDPNYSQQYALNNSGQTGGTADADVDAPEGWLSVTGAEAPVIIAVCDDGVDTAHPDLAANIWVNPGEIAGNGIDDDANGFIDDVKGWDFESNDNNVIATASHGTHVAGIIGMVRNNGIGGAGAAKNVRIMPLRMYGTSSAWMSNLANAVDYARVKGAKVISVSYNIDGYTTTLRDAIGRCAINDVIYCNSAGNNNQNIDTRRGTLRPLYNHVVFVASTDHNDVRSSFSNYGTTVDIAAPGSSIYSTLPSNTYGLQSGTSMATPLAAAILGTIRQLNPGLTASQTIALARATSDPIASLAVPMNGGRINLLRSIAPPDTIAPSEVAGFTRDRRSATSVRLNWLATGDDGAVGNAANYEIRFSTSPITAANFSAATLAANVPGGLPSGAGMSTNVVGLVPATTYYFAIRAFDDFSNTSPITSLSPVTTGAPRWRDDLEGTPGWTSTTWSLINGTAPDSKMWTDSATGVYGNNIDVTLNQINPISVTAPAFFKFRMRGVLESTYDFISLEATTNNGATWTTLFRTSTPSVGWSTESASLLPYIGQSVKLRFRITTDNSVTADGVYLDDFSIIDAQSIESDPVNAATWFTARAGGTFARSNAQFLSGPEAWNDSPAGLPANGAESWIESKIFDTSEIADPSIAFWLNANLARTDELSAQSLGSNGSWTQIARIVGRNAEWAHLIEPIPSFTGARFGVRLKSGTAPGQGAVLDDFTLIGESFKTLITGSLGSSVAGIANANPARTTTITVIQGATSTTYPLTLDSNGNFSVDVNGTGTALLRFAGPGWLSRTVSGANLAAALSVGTINLPNGDVDLDGEIGPGDFEAVVNAFGTASASADVDGDGEVGPSDFEIVVQNFGLQSQ
jgi:hypothetical protein